MTVFMKPWKSFPSPIPSDKKPVMVAIVDEDQIEESGVNPDFVEGDNWIHDQRQADHPHYVPDHHILLASRIMDDPVKVIKTLAHELSEIVAEAFGLPYNVAHEEVANPVETDQALTARHRAPRLPWGGR